MKGGIEMRKS